MKDLNGDRRYIHIKVMTDSNLGKKSYSEALSQDASGQEAMGGVEIPEDWNHTNGKVERRCLRKSV